VADVSKFGSRERWILDFGLGRDLSVVPCFLTLPTPLNGYGYFDSKTTNGPVEGINNKLKLIKRLGFGFSNF
jgi:hypothetical protein